MTAVAVSGTLGPYRQLVDGTLSVVVLIDPRFRADFHALFDIDQGVALVPLAMGAAIEPAVAEASTKTAGEEIADAAAVRAARAVKSRFPGGLCGLAVRWCADEHFQEWLTENFENAVGVFGELPPEDMAKELICAECGVDSRKELDMNSSAGSLFKKLILEPYALQRKKDGLDE